MPKQPKTYKIVFWGGPKDGHIEYDVEMPSRELYCLSQESELLTLKDVYHKSLSDQTTPSYYRYIRPATEVGKVVHYRFHGLY